jgi:hypothetical protein
MRESEEDLTSVIGVELSLSDLILFRLELKSVQSLLWLNSWHHRSVLFEVLSEADNVLYENFDTDDQSLLEIRLLPLEVVSDLNSLLDKFIPIFVDDLGWVFVALLVDVLIIKVVLKKVVHLDDWSELNLDGGLLLSDLFKSVHDVTKRVDILSWLLNLKSDVLDLFGEVVNVGLSFLKEVLSVSVFPENNPFVETSLDIVGL